MQEIEQLIKLFSRLPGFGPRTSKRIVLQLLKNPSMLLFPLADGLRSAGNAIVTCAVCGNIDTHSPCSICRDTKRDQDILCVVEDVADLWALSRSMAFRGQFHVLGGVLSPMDGITPSDLNISGLLQRIATHRYREVILATNLTVEGQTTAHYIAEKLVSFDGIVTRLAHGVPIGGELDYLDDGTISVALNSRTAVD